MTDTLEIYVSPLGYVTLFIDEVIVSPKELPDKKFKKVKLTGKSVNGRREL